MKSLFMCLTLAAVFAFAQEQQDKAKTSIEKFMTESKNTTIKTYTALGKINASVHGYYLEITAVNFQNPNTGRNQQGISFDIQEGENKKHRSFVDYDEIQDLLSGLSYIKTIDKPNNPLENYEAIYSTRGDLVFTVFNSNKKICMAIASGDIYKATCIIDLSQVDTIIADITKAKALLDSVK